MSNKILYIIIGVAVVLGIIAAVMNRLTPVAEAPTATSTATTTEGTACTMDAMQCPDGSYVGRTGPNCEFVCPEVKEPTVPPDVQKDIDAKADLIKISEPKPMTVINSPLTITGEARGTWFFEASAPVVLTDWDGKIIAQGHIEAVGEWMTENFVPFKGTLTFTSPFTAGMQDTMKRGTLILKKDNPSGLPQNDQSLEIPVQFAE